MDSALVQSWRAAAADLSVDVEIRGDAMIVTQFGSAAGMLCALLPTLEGQAELQQQAEALGMGWSVLGPSYLRYDRALFIDTLNDWGWCDPGTPAAWYRGEPWSQ